MDPEEFRSKVKTGLVIGAFFGVALLFYLMEWRGLLTVYLFLLAAVAVLAILIQSGRGGGLAASLGGIGGDSLLGVRSASPIAKATYVMLALFLFIGVLRARLGPAEATGSGLLQPQQQAPAVQPELPEQEAMPGAGPVVPEQPTEAPAAPEATPQPEQEPAE